MNCTQAQNEILEAFDETRPTQVRREVDAHLETCVRCAAFLARQRTLDAHLTSVLRAPDPSPAFRARLRSRIDREPLRPRSDALPDVVHLTSCGLSTLLVSALMPFDPALTIAIGATVTVLTYALLTFARSSFEDAES